jgi:ABC-type nitrate/sulfonate/bicarbonate transport system ATPase subunit
LSSVNLKINQSAYTEDSSHKTIIEHIYFAIDNSEFICIVGPSGCGKTTLLDTIAGLLNSPNARVTFAQGNIRLGYIFQEPCLMSWLTLQQNIELELPQSNPQLVEQVLKEVCLFAYSEHYPNVLSGGMLRRASIAHEFVIQPQLLLLDEPFVSLDLPTAMKYLELLLKMAKLHQTIMVFVTHDVNEALYMAVRIVFLSNSPSIIIHPLVMNRTAQQHSRDYESPQ